MEKFLEMINSVIWGVPALALILGVGIYYSCRTGWIQLRLLPKALGDFLRQFGKDGDTEGESSFRALCTALAATVGTGNIAGVAGAIAIGGPGSIFWMWICAVLGMVTKFAEAVLAVHFQKRDASGQLLGGPMYMIRYGMGKKWHFLAYLYCIFGIVAAYGMGNGTQINAVIDSANAVKGFLQYQSSRRGDIALGMALAVLAAVCISGGGKRIGNVAVLLVPLASAAYLVLGIGAVMYHGNQLPGALLSIITGAVSPRAVTGGILGSGFTALRIGASRGVFTNEAGMGTAAIAHGASEVKDPVKQGMMGIVEVFLDTIVICTLTALVILTSGTEIQYGLDEGAVLTTRAFACTYGQWVSIPLCLFLCCFAFATMLGWGLYGLRCAQFLFGDGAWKPFLAVQLAASFAAVFLKTGTVWMLSETVNGLMAIPNLLALAALSPICIEYVKKQERRSALVGIKREGKTAVRSKSLRCCGK